MGLRIYIQVCIVLSIAMAFAIGFRLGEQHGFSDGCGRDRSACISYGHRAKLDTEATKCKRRLRQCTSDLLIEQSKEVIGEQDGQDVTE
jgi:hypothetical protein